MELNGICLSKIEIPGIIILCKESDQFKENIYFKIYDIEFIDTNVNNFNLFPFGIKWEKVKNYLKRRNKPIQLFTLYQTKYG